MNKKYVVVFLLVYSDHGSNDDVFLHSYMYSYIIDQGHIY